nr:MAG TPA: hypothetical protein [Bacteriophage sp.]DAZ79046.1 MAG TPA: hypothetical protein [Caudoviricetes sp.]
MTQLNVSFLFFIKENDHFIKSCPNATRLNISSSYERSK